VIDGGQAESAGAGRGDAAPDRAAAERLPGRRARVGWMLRVNRLFHPDAGWSRLGVFARAFRGGCSPRPAATSTVSRWETGDLAVPTTTLRRYEELLELPPSLLDTTARTLLRYLAPGAVRIIGPPRADTPSAEDGPPIEDLLDAATGSTVLTGRDWETLTDLLAAAGPGAVMPGRVWREISARLVREMVIADGTAWLLRFEALNTLLNHPRGAGAAIGACIDFAGDESGAGVLEVVCALDNTASPEASIFLAGQFREPLHARVRSGALLASLRKIGYGHYTSEQLRTIARSAAETAGSVSERQYDRSLAIELIKALPPALTAAAGRDVTRQLREAELQQAQRNTPRTAYTELLALRVLGSLEREIPGYEDKLLVPLISEMLHSPSPDARLYVSCLLNATPFAAPVAALIAQDLSAPAALRDPGRALPMLDALRFLGGQRQRALIERLVLTPGLPAPVVATALHHLAHVGRDSSPAFWSAAVAHLIGDGRRAQAELRADPLAVHDLVYALGRADQDEYLAAIRADPRIAAPARAAARWWLTLPEHIRKSSAL